MHQTITQDQFQNIMKALDQLKITDKTGSFSGTSFSRNSISVGTRIIDSGASDHIICDEQFFSHIHKRPHSSVSVRLSNGNTTYVDKIGTVHLSPNIILKNVLYIPDFEFNLISISKTYENNSCCAIFNSENFRTVRLAN